MNALSQTYMVPQQLPQESQHILLRKVRRANRLARKNRDRRAGRKGN